MYNLCIISKLIFSILNMKRCKHCNYNDYWALNISISNMILIMHKYAVKMYSQNLLIITAILGQYLQRLQTFEIYFLNMAKLARDLHYI